MLKYLMTKENKDKRAIEFKNSSAPCLAYLALKRLPAVKWATKTELYISLVKARGYIASNYDNPICLRDAAYIACMSPYHFHRMFRVLFQETPHQFLNRIRFMRAKNLLETTQMQVSEICFAVGFRSRTTFSNKFLKFFGSSPNEFRQHKKNSLVYFARSKT